MAKKEKSQVSESLPESAAEIAAPTEKNYELARVLKDFVFSVKTDSFSPSYPQTFRRGVIVNNAILIKQMLQTNMPIELLDE